MASLATILQRKQLNLCPLLQICMRLRLVDAPVWLMFVPDWLLTIVYLFWLLNQEWVVATIIKIQILFRVLIQLQHLFARNAASVLFYYFEFRNRGWLILYLSYLGCANAFLDHRCATSRYRVDSIFQLIQLLITGRRIILQNFNLMRGHLWLFSTMSQHLLLFLNDGLV